MLILGLETCTPSGGMALLELSESGPDRLLASTTVLSGRAQSRLLAQSVQDALRELDLTVAQIDVVAVANGPGSFTGVRVGLALAKGLCLPPGGPRLVCVSSLEALAWNAWSGEDVEAVIPMHDALRGEVYARIAPVNKSGLSLLPAKDECLSIDALVAQWPARALVAGGGAMAHREELERQLASRILWPRGDRSLPDPRSVALLGGMFARQQQWADPLLAGPVYLRDATVKMKER